MIVSDDELKVRVETDQSTIQEYYEAMETEEDVKKFPPLVVYFDGCRYWLADGHHRYRAILRRGFKKVLVKVIDGTHDEAVLAAVKLNSQNGLRFNDGDWEKIIPLIAGKELWKGWTNRKLAEELNCSHSTVNKYRPDDSVGSGLPTEKRRGKDGKMYKARKAKKPKSVTSKSEASSKPATQTGDNDRPVQKINAEEFSTPPSKTASPPTVEQALSVSTEQTSENVNCNDDWRVIAAKAKCKEIVSTLGGLKVAIDNFYETAPPEEAVHFTRKLCRRVIELNSMLDRIKHERELNIKDKKMREILGRHFHDDLDRVDEIMDAMTAPENVPERERVVIDAP